MSNEMLRFDLHDHTVGIYTQKGQWGSKATEEGDAINTKTLQPERNRYNG